MAALPPAGNGASPEVPLATSDCRPQPVVLLAAREGACCCGPSSGRLPPCMRLPFSFCVPGDLRLPGCGLPCVRSSSCVPTTQPRNLHRHDRLREPQLSYNEGIWSQSTNEHFI